MEPYSFKFSDRLAIFESTSPWYYVEVPKEESTLIRNKYRNIHRGWGSIPVTAQIGDTTWKTSIFWEKKGQYLLFVKKEVRSKEKITNGSQVEVMVEIGRVI